MKNFKILLAEDNSTLSMLLKFRLEKEGYQLFLAEDGAQATNIMKNESPDLVLTDVMMPYKNGLEVISYLRNVLNKEIPVIVFSAAGQEEMVLKAFKLGANDFMAKPFSPNELLIRIERLLN